jgi:ABC-type sugar transport system ATPase subunit
LSVRENISMAAPHLVSTLGLVSRKRDARLAQRFVDSLRIKTPSLWQKVRNLSGGNQQKTVVAKWLATNSKILLMDEPTRGIDVGAKAEMFALMDDLARQGHAILMFSSELEEILGMSDTILVMHRGRVVARLPRAEATQERIMYYATGGGEDDPTRAGPITQAAHREG